MYMDIYIPILIYLFIAAPFAATHFIVSQVYIYMYMGIYIPILIYLYIAAPFAATHFIVSQLYIYMYMGIYIYALPRWISSNWHSASGASGTVRSHTLHRLAGIYVYMYMDIYIHLYTNTYVLIYRGLTVSEMDHFKTTSLSRGLRLSLQPHTLSYRRSFVYIQMSTAPHTTGFLRLGTAVALIKQCKYMHMNTNTYILIYRGTVRSHPLHCFPGAPLICIYMCICKYI